MKRTLDRNKLKMLAETLPRKYDGSFFYCPMLSAAIAARNDRAMHTLMEKALHAGITARTLNEIILQTHLFLGYPAMIEASRMLAEITGGNDPSEKLPAPYTARQCRAWNKSGLIKIRRIYGPIFDRLVNYVNYFSPQILTWMINEGYGMVLSRPGASFKLRELSVVAILTVTSYRNQLLAHIRGALNTGVDAELLRITIENCGHFCSQRRVEKSLLILEQSR